MTPLWFPNITISKFINIPPITFVLGSLMVTLTFISPLLYGQSTEIDKQSLSIWNKNQDATKPRLAILSDQIIFRDQTDENPDHLSLYLYRSNAFNSIISFFNSDNELNLSLSALKTNDIRKGNHGQLLIKGKSAPIFTVDGQYIPGLRLRNIRLFEEWSLGFYWDSAINSNNFNADHNKLAFAHNAVIKSAIDKNGTYWKISDENLKTDIKEINHGLSTILKLNPIIYNYKNGNKKKTFGFIAQQVKKYLPELVTHISNDKNDQYLLNYSGIIPILTNAINEQTRDVEERTIEALSLEKRIKSLELELLKNPK